VLLCSTLATVKNKTTATLFGRSISAESIRKAVAVTVMFLAICLTSTVCLMATTDASALDVVYETVSATATVGLSRNLTGSLNAVSKCIIIVTMYLGRVGPISLAVALGSSNQSQNVITEPSEEISIG
jgi:trk system potassium uptake protein TrkH